MECEVFQQKLCEDCSQSTPEMDEHERACVSCAAFAARARKTEWLIQDALRFDIASVKSAATADRAPSPVVERRFVAWAGLAATFVGAVAVWFALQTTGPMTTEELVVEVLEHWDHEPESWAVSNVSVSNVVLERALDGKATIDLANLGTVSFARSCRVAGQWLPHLVVQTEQGPVMVLLVPNQAVKEAVGFSLPEHGIEGTLHPHGSGSIAVIGNDSLSIEPVEEQISESVDWTI